MRKMFGDKTYWGIRLICKEKGGSIKRKREGDTGKGRDKERIERWKEMGKDTDIFKGNG